MKLFMTLTPATIKPAFGSKRKVKRVGRGNGSGRGTYSGRGGKGQTARSGGKKRTQIRGFKPYLQKIPKVRGFKSIYKKPETVTLETLNRLAEEGKEITPHFLKTRGVIGHTENGVKIVATGELKKKITVKGCKASKQAVEVIEKVGGSVAHSEPRK